MIQLFAERRVDARPSSVSRELDTFNETRCRMLEAFTALAESGFSRADLTDEMLAQSERCAASATFWQRTLPMPDDGRQRYPLEGLAIRQPPSNMEAEAASISGALLSNNRSIDLLGEHLTPEHFYDPPRPHLWRMLPPHHLRPDGRRGAAERVVRERPGRSRSRRQTALPI